MVTDLVARGYVDDAEFARRWVEIRAGARLLGRARLRRELRSKGVSADVVETAIGEALPSSGDESRALAAARQRWPALKRRDTVRAPTRLAAFLGRRGYPAGIVARVVRTLSGLEHDTASDEDA